jgi:hypothetical protein
VGLIGDDGSALVESVASLSRCGLGEEIVVGSIFIATGTVEIGAGFRGTVCRHGGVARFRWSEGVITCVCLSVD